MTYKKVYVLVDIRTKQYLCFYRIDHFLSNNITDAEKFDSEEDAIAWLEEEQKLGNLSYINSVKVRDYYKKLNQ